MIDLKEERKKEDLTASSNSANARSRRRAIFQAQLAAARASVRSDAGAPRCADE